MYSHRVRNFTMLRAVALVGAIAAVQALAMTDTAYEGQSSSMLHKAVFGLIDCETPAPIDV